MLIISMELNFSKKKKKFSPHINYERKKSPVPRGGARNLFWDGFEY